MSLGNETGDPNFHNIVVKVGSSRYKSIGFKNAIRARLGVISSPFLLTFAE
jgi:hypothetical protein